MTIQEESRWKHMNNIKRAIEILNKGGIIIFPTDTAYGIGCRIDNVDSIKRLFDIRKRSENKAVPVLVSDIDMAKDYLLEIPKDVKEKLMEKYWPGALTIILPCIKNKVPSLVRGEGNNLGIRVPDNKLILEIIKKVGVPILAPSANFSGEKTPFTSGDLDKNLVKLVDMVIDKGESLTNNVSTVIDCSVLPWKVVRKGQININI